MANPELLDKFNQVADELPAVRTEIVAEVINDKKFIFCKQGIWSIIRKQALWSESWPVIYHALQSQSVISTKYLGPMQEKIRNELYLAKLRQELSNFGKIRRCAAE